MGVPLPGVSVRIGDENGNALRDGEIGEVLIRGPNVFRGYWHAGEKTTEMFVTDAEGERWFRSGDLGKLDPATGVYTLVGCKQDLIICGGFNVSPREVEELLLQHPAVLEAAIGIRDTAKAELPVAFVVLHADKPAPAEGRIEHCTAHLARYRVPRSVTFLDSLPRNAMGKVEKKRLFAHFAHTDSPIQRATKGKSARPLRGRSRPSHKVDVQLIIRRSNLTSPERQ